MTTDAGSLDKYIFMGSRISLVLKFDKFINQWDLAKWRNITANSLICLIFIRDEKKRKEG